MRGRICPDSSRAIEISITTLSFSPASEISAPKSSPPEAHLGCRKESVFDADHSIILWLFFSQWRIYPPMGGIGTDHERTNAATFETRILVTALAIWIRVISA